jgi:hypothetical protein
MWTKRGPTHDSLSGSRSIRSRTAVGQLLEHHRRELGRRDDARVEYDGRPYLAAAGISRLSQQGHRASHPTLARDWPCR